MIENIGVPFPTEASYLLAIDLLQKGYPYSLMLIWLTAAHLVGSVLAFGLGWWGEGWLTRRLQHRPGYIKASKAIHKWYTAYGRPTTFAARLVGYVRPWSSLVAGFAHIEVMPFIFWTLTGSLLFNVIALVVMGSLWEWWFRYGLWFKIGLVILFVLSFSVVFYLNHCYHQHDIEIDS